MRHCLISLDYARLRGRLQQQICGICAGDSYTDGALFPFGMELAHFGCTCATITDEIDLRLEEPLKHPFEQRACHVDVPAGLQRQLMAPGKVEQGICHKSAAPFLCTGRHRWRAGPRRPTPVARCPVEQLRAVRRPRRVFSPPARPRLPSWPPGSATVLPPHPNSLGRPPRLFRFGHGVENDEQLAHTSNECELLRFVLGE